MPTILIACLDKWNSLNEIPFVFKKAGCDVHLLCYKLSWVRQNKFYDVWIEAKEGAEQYKSQLIEIAKTKKYDLIILGDEFLIRLMSDINDENYLSRILPIKNSADAYMLGSKEGFAKFCLTHNLNAPKFLKVNCFNEKPELEKLISFPVLLKQDFGSNGSGIIQCDNPESLKLEISRMHGKEKEKLIIQQYVQGKEVAVEAFFWNGHLLCYNTSNVMELGGNRFSFSTKRRYYRDTSIEKDLKQLGVSAGITGFASITYMCDEERGMNYLIEADLRPNSWIRYGAFAGNDFSDALKRLFFGSSEIISPTSTQKSIEIAIFEKDIRRCILKKDFKGLLKWVFNYKYWRYIPFYDTLLFYKIISGIRRDVVELIKKKFSRRKG